MLNVESFELLPREVVKEMVYTARAKRLSTPPDPGERECFVTICDDCAERLCQRCEKYGMSLALAATHPLCKLMPFLGLHLPPQAWKPRMQRHPAYPILNLSDSAVLQTHATGDVAIEKGELFVIAMCLLLRTKLF